MQPILEPVISFHSPGQHLCGLAWDGMHLWHSDAGEERLYRMDPATGAVLQSFACPGVQTDLAFDGRYLWQIVDLPKRICCLNPSDGASVRELAIDPPTRYACGLEIAGDHFWLGLETEGRLQLRAFSDRQVLREFSVEQDISGICLGAGWLWYGLYQGQALVAIDPETGIEQVRYRVAARPTGLTWDGARLWYADYEGKQIQAVQP